jgi:glycosyltransferase involved in cell wall biosynthesis
VSAALRVLHIDTEKTWRGGEQQALYLAQGLQRRGVEQLCVGRPGMPYVERCAAAGLDVEVIHMHTSHAHTLGVVARGWAGVGRTLVSRRVDFTIYRNFLRLSWFKYRFGVDRYVAISQGIKRQMVKDGIPAGRIEVVHSGIDLRRFDGVEAHDYRAEFGLPDDARIIGDVAAFGWHKAQEYLVRATPRILEAVPQAYVFLIGDGELRPKIEEEVRALGLEDRVRFTGFRTDVPALIRGMDCFVMCSVLEGLCTSLLDALALECPAVGSAVGGIPEVLVDGETGLTVPARDPTALADAVVRVLTDDALAAGLRERGLRHVLDGFTVDAMVEGNLGVYRRLVGRPS